MRGPRSIGGVIVLWLLASGCGNQITPTQPSPTQQITVAGLDDSGSGSGGTFTLQVTRNGTGSGTATSSPSGISCGTTCSHAFSGGTTVTLTAVPASGSVFAGWSGGGCSGTGTCTTQLNANTTVTATFNPSGQPPPPPPAGAVAPTALSLSNPILDQVGNLSIAGVNFPPNPPVPLTFSVQSSHPGNASVPASVTVQNFSDPGNPVASFNVTYASVVSAPTQVTISVSAAGVTKAALLTLNPPPAPTLAPGERGPGFVGSDFTTFSTLGTTIALGPNGVGPLRVDFLSGRLPDGLSLADPKCATPAKCPYVFIVGIPTRVQTSTFTVRGTDARGQEATGTFTITINPAQPLAITPQQWAPATVGSFSNLWIDGSGGTRPYRWALTAGQLPPGMSLIQDNPSGPSVRVGGTPAAAGTFSFTLRMTDATNATVSRTFSVTIN